MYSSRVVYNAGTGSSNTGALYSFGVAGAGSVGDRALGSVGSSGTGTVYWGVKLTNNTGSTITSLTVQFAGEQWRNGGSSSVTPSVEQVLDFQYSLSATAINTPSTGWTDYDALDFASPIFGTVTPATLDGNLAANRVQKSSSVPVSIANGQEIWLRWRDIDHANNDHALAIDDLKITANGGPVDPAPNVTGATPTNGATNVAINSSIVINFSESVNATPNAFSLHCPTGTQRTLIQSATPAASFTLTPQASLPYGTTCTLTVNASQITDVDGVDPDDQMASNYVFSFSTVPPPIDPAPVVTGTTPANNAHGVAVASNIVINFSEPVQAGANAFSLACPSLQSFAVSPSSGGSLTLNPDADFPYGATCTVIVTASQVTDVDTADPDDAMAADYSFSFMTAEPPLAGANVIINELDADTPGSDTAEFVELFDGGAGNTPLDGLVVVFYTGADSNTPADEVDKSYAAFDLDGYTTNSDGYFTLGNPGVPGVDLIFSPGEFGLLQNGADAVAIYAGNASDFPFKTAVTTANLQDAIVYGTDDPTDAVLITLLNAGQEQVNENAGGSGINQSNQRCANGTGGARDTFTYRQAMPTPDGENTLCVPDPVPGSSVIVISQVYGGGGNGTGASAAPYRNDFVELFNRGTATVDITGWSLQYASSTGSGWDFNKQPLAGTIAPGEYYLISLASGGAAGAPLPAANVAGGLINMAAGSGKIALVDNFTALTGTCPKFSAHLKDLVGYGTAANCREGLAAAPTGTNTLALFRKLGGVTDTDQNGSDFQTAAPAPRRTAPIVELGPYVLGTDPREDATDAPRDATIQVTFTEPVTLDAGWFNVSCASSGVHNSVTEAATGQSYYLTPNTNFHAGESCTATVFKDHVHDVDTDDGDPNSDTLIADYSWSFVVASGTPPPYPSSVHVALGTPTGAQANVGQPNDYLMDKPEFTLSYNRDLGRPNWVSWHLSSEWFGSLARIDTFRADPEVPADWYRVQSFDFAGSGFDRGHMVPNADRDKETSTPINQATFLMSNMIAQAPDNNQGPWAAFEGYLRELAGTANEIYIVAGGSGIGGTGGNGPASLIANGHVTVPERTWKVALVLPKADGGDVSRISCETRTIAINMPNIQGIRNDNWEDYLTTVDAVESLTGYDLFSNVPAAVQACVESGTNGNNPPLDSTPPTVTCASPDNLWHADNISLGCTASDGGSGLAHAGDTSFTLATTVIGDIEDANASTGSRMVCDVAGNCTAAGPIAGNKIDRKAPTVNLITPLDGAWHAGHFAVAHTAVDGGSGLANAADGSFSLVTAVVDGTADANASTDARTVCDAVGNCAQAGPIGGIKIDRIDPVITLVAPPDGAIYQLERAIVATYSCADNNSGVAICAGNVANGASLDTASTGAKTFVVNVSDAAGNLSSVTVTYTVKANTVSISNIPATAFEDESFVPAFAYAGDGAVSATSTTTKQCTVSGGIVNFHKKGTCTLIPHAAATATFDAAAGPPQSFVIEKDKPKKKDN
jgi:endonuclease G